VEFLGLSRCEVEDTRELRATSRDEIRRWRPDLVITMNPHRTYNLGGSHRDHRTVAGVTLDCVYPLARDHLSFPELMPDFEPHKALEIHLMQWENPQLVVDISDVMDLKIKALACHASQFRRLRRRRERNPRARGRARQAERLRPTRRRSTGSCWRDDPLLAGLLSVLLSLSAIAGYYVLLRVPAVRNHPALYLVAFAIAAVIAGAATWHAARWPNFVALGLSAVLLILGVLQLRARASAGHPDGAPRWRAGA